MEIIWQAVVHMPWWIYLSILILIIIGIRTTRTQVIGIRKLWISPFIVTAISIHTLLTAVNFNILTVGTWTISIILGILLGYWLAAFLKIRVDREHKRFEVPGTWIVLVTIFIIFGIRYFFDYELSIDPERAEDTAFEYTMLAAFGVCTGMFIGRLLCYLYRLETEPSVNLIPW